MGDCICVTRDWMLGEVEWFHTRYGEARARGLVEPLGIFIGYRKSGIVYE